MIPSCHQKGNVVQARRLRGKDARTICERNLVGRNNEKSVTGLSKYIKPQSPVTNS
jgi:hypothetical protein